MRKVLVDGKECVKFLGGEHQESAILHPAPAHFDYGSDQVCWQ